MASGHEPRARVDERAGKPDAARAQRSVEPNEVDAPDTIAATIAAAKSPTAGAPTPPVVPPPSMLRLQRSAGNAAVAAMLGRNVRKAAARPAIQVSRKAALDEEWTGPAPEADSTDVDVSEFTSDPRAAEELAKKPAPALPKAPPAPTGPPPPAKPKVLGKVKPTPKPPKGPKKAGHSAKAAGKGTGGDIVKRPPPPAPPKYKFVPGMQVAEPGPLAKRLPMNDPAFTKVAKAAKLTVKKAKKHPSGKQEGDAAQLAAKAPPNDKEAQAEAAHADTMAAAKPKEFSADDFYKAMKSALDQARPKNLKEATDLESKAGHMQEAVKGTVDSSKNAAAADVKEKSEQAPDPSKATPKPEAPMTKTEVEEPAPMKASGAMPAPVPSEQVDMRAGPAQVDQQMADAEVSEEQLKESNEPEFNDALKSKKEGEEHSDKAPVELRKKEAAILNKATSDAASAEKTAIGGAKSQIGAAMAKVAGGKDATKSKDEVARKQVADNINKIYDVTKKDVDAILDGLDTKVEQTFESEEAKIRKRFTDDWNRRLSAYKSRRYSGLRGKWRWVRDKFKGLPEAANKEYEASQRVYEADMDKLARRLSTLVAGELNAATRRIQQGRNEVAAYVGGLKGDLAKIGQEAAAELSDKFDELDSGVKDKFDDLAKSLGKKYAESEDAVKAEIEAAKEANKGLIDKAIDAVKGVINTIRNLKDLLLNVLAKAAAVIGDIIRSPIKFAKNLFSAIKNGVQRFADNILDHLKKGLMGWLFGALGAANIEIPDSFDLKGVFTLVTSVLGLTWNVIRGAFVKRIGEPAMNALEKGSSLVQNVIKQGPVALIEQLLEKLPDLEDMILGKIKEIIVDKVVVAGITFLISMLNPASAFIKACKMIYDVIRWFMDNGERIRELINTILDSVADIARGGVGGVPEKIEGVLAKFLPMAIGFLASLVGMGGIGKKVSEIVDRVRKPITKAIDKVVGTITKMTKPIWGPVVKMGKKLYAKGKAKYEAGKKYVKEKVDAGKKWAKNKVGAVKDRVLKILGLPRSKSTNMAGEAHTLAVERSGATVSLTMASRRGDLFAKLAAEQRWLDDNGAPAPKRKALGKVQSLAVKLVEEGKMAVGAKDEAAAKERIANVNTRLKELGKALTTYADLPPKRTDLGGAGPSKKLDDSELRKNPFAVLAAEADAVEAYAADRNKRDEAKEAHQIAVKARKAEKQGATALGAPGTKMRAELDALKKKLGVVGDEGELFHDNEEAGIVGEVGQHRNQGSSNRTSRKTYLHLESEHVIPRDWINNYLMHFHNRAVSSDFYDQMTTVMLYKTASNRKTYGNPPPLDDTFVAASESSSDNETAKKMKKVIAGMSEGAGTSNRDALLKALPQLLSGRIEATMAAQQADLSNKGLCDKRTKAGKPLMATRAQVEMAAMRQLKQLEEYVKKGHGSTDPTGKLKEVEIDFKMGSADHELFYDPPGKLEMASERGPLVKKLEHSLAVLEDTEGASNAQIRELRGILDLAKRAEIATGPAERLKPEQILKKDTPDALKKLQTLLDALAKALDAYGARWNKPDLPKDKPKDGEEVEVPDAEGKTAAQMGESPLYKQFGMPTQNALYAMSVAARFNVTILVRPTNPTAPVLLEQGLLPKPEALKMKTINGLDVVLGRNAGVKDGDQGKVGYFKPELPKEGTDDYNRRGIVERYVQRLKEYNDERAKILKLEKKGRVEVQEGKLVDLRSGKQFTGDHDLYAILDSAGKPLVDGPGETEMLRIKEAVVAALRGGPFRAQHGAHLDWKPKTSVEQRIFDVIVKAHEAGEALLKVTASGCSVTYHKPTYIASED